VQQLLKPNVARIHYGTDRSGESQYKEEWRAASPKLFATLTADRDYRV
jgi:hypothetical protein